MKWLALVEYQVKKKYKHSYDIYWLVLVEVRQQLA